jgi:regulator of protease activity HflC (stomatin/prohibitin superfamily)
VRLPVGLDLDATRDHRGLARVRDKAEARVMRAERDRCAEVVRAVAQHDGAAAGGDRQVCSLLDGAEGCTQLA